MDDPLSQTLFDKWKGVVKKLDLLPTLKIPRFIGCVRNSDSRLLIFCDASITSYAAVVYLRIETDNSVKVNLVFSKSRLASKEITFP